MHLVYPNLKFWRPQSKRIPQATVDPAAWPLQLSTLPHDILLEIAALLAQLPPEIPYLPHKFRPSDSLLLCYEPSPALSAFSRVCRACHAASTPVLWQNLRIGSFEHIFDPATNRSPSAQWTEALHLDRVDEICELVNQVQEAPVDVRRRIRRLRWVGLDISLGYSLLKSLPDLQELRLIPSYMSLRLLPDSSAARYDMNLPNLRYLSLDTSASSISLILCCPALECLKLFCYPGTVYALLYTEFLGVCDGLKTGGSFRTLRILEFAGHSFSFSLYKAAIHTLLSLPLDKLEVLSINHFPMHEPPELPLDVNMYQLQRLPSLRAIGFVQHSEHGTDSPGRSDPAVYSAWHKRSLAISKGTIQRMCARMPKLEYLSLSTRDEGVVRRLWRVDSMMDEEGGECIQVPVLLQEDWLTRRASKSTYPGFPLHLDAAWAEFAD